MSLLQRLKERFIIDHSGLTFNMVKSVSISFFTKGGVAVITLLLVPIYLKLLTKEEFGIWQTITSLISWFYFLDIGLNNSFKNLFTKAVSERQPELAIRYLSTIYALIGIVSILFLLVFELVNPFLNWGAILNFDKNQIASFDWVIQLVFISFGVKLVFGVLNTTLIANQQYSASTLIDFLSNLFIITSTYLIFRMEISTFFRVAAIATIIPVLTLLIATFLYFRVGSLRNYRPSFVHVDLKLFRALFGKGIQFFFIQVSVVLMFMANNMVVTQIFGPESVTELSIVNKYFTIPMMGFVIVLGPFWSGFTEAYFKKEIGWIMVTIKRLLLVWIGFLGLIWTMYFWFDELSQIWLGTLDSINNRLLLLYAIFASLSTFNNIFAYFLNGIGAIRIQLFSSTIFGLLSVPLSILLCTYTGLGVNGVLVSNILCIASGSLLGPLQYYRVVHQKAGGIWLK